MCAEGSTHAPCGWLAYLTRLVTRSRFVQRGGGGFHPGPSAWRSLRVEAIPRPRFPSCSLPPIPGLIRLCRKLGRWPSPTLIRPRPVAVAHLQAGPGAGGQARRCPCRRCARGLVSLIPPQRPSASPFVARQGLSCSLDYIAFSKKIATFRFTTPTEGSAWPSSFGKRIRSSHGPHAFSKRHFVSFGCIGLILSDGPGSDVSSATRRVLALSKDSVDWNRLPDGPLPNASTF